MQERHENYLAELAKKRQARAGHDEEKQRKLME